MSNFIQKFFERRELDRYMREADRVMAYDEQMGKLSDEELIAKTKEFQERLAKGETLESIKYEAFAVAREAAWRVLHQKPFKVQIVGAQCLDWQGRPRRHGQRVLG